MFSNLNWWEIIGLALLGLFIFGPERLPKVISDGVRMLRTLRNMARNATSDLSRELGTDVRLEDLHPKTFLRKHLLSADEEAALRRPFDDIYSDLSRELRRDYWVDPLGEPALGPGRSGQGSAGPDPDLGLGGGGGVAHPEDPARGNGAANANGIPRGPGRAPGLSSTRGFDPDAT